MWLNSKLLQSPTQVHPHPHLKPSTPLVQFQDTTISPSRLTLVQSCNLSRRELAICTNSSLLLLLASQNLNPAARADETATNSIEDEKSTNTNQPTCFNEVPTKRVFIDISVDREPKGRIVIGLYENDVPYGAARFSDLVTGAAGISYRRKEFVKITPNFVQHGGVRSYGIDLELARRTGSNLDAENLVTEWEKVSKTCSGTKNVSGTVAILVRDPLKPPPKMKLVARGGKLEIDEEEVGTEPNGTEFVISMRDSPELDESALVVGKVLDGMDVVEKISQVKTVQDNTTSGFFRVAKLIGDKRAVVAERGFNRPYSKVVVTNCGLME